MEETKGWFVSRFKLSPRVWVSSLTGYGRLLKENPWLLSREVWVSRRRLTVISKVESVPSWGCLRVWDDAGPVCTGGSRSVPCQCGLVGRRSDHNFGSVLTLEAWFSSSFFRSLHRCNSNESLTGSEIFMEEDGLIFGRFGGNWMYLFSGFSNHISRLSTPFLYT